MWGCLCNLDLLAAFRKLKFSLTSASRSEGVLGAKGKTASQIERLWGMVENSYENEEPTDRLSLSNTESRFPLSSSPLCLCSLVCSCCASSFPAHTESHLSLLTAVGAESNYLKVVHIPLLWPLWACTTLFEDQIVQTNFSRKFTCRDDKRFFSMSMNDPAIFSSDVFSAELRFIV